MNNEMHIEGLKAIKPFLQKKMREYNYEGMGEIDAKEVGEICDAAIEALEKEDKYRWHDLEKKPEDLPEERESIFNKFFGTDRWREAMFRRISDDVITKIVFDDGTCKTCLSHTTDGKFPNKYKNIHKFQECKVIAWKYIEPFEMGEQL